MKLSYSSVLVLPILFAMISTSNGGEDPAALQSAVANVNDARVSIAIDAGGGSSSATWVADKDFFAAGGSGVEVGSDEIDISHVSNPAPQAVYHTQRYARSLIYLIIGLTPSAKYNVRLHFVESYFHVARKRVFNIQINGVDALSRLDIFGAAGGFNKALIESFASAATSNGKIAVTLNAIVNKASIAGLEVRSAGPTTFYLPTASMAPKLPLFPNPFTERICNSDPCSPAIDLGSATFNANWFGSSLVLPHVTTAIPGNVSSVAYESIPLYVATNANQAYTVICTRSPCSSVVAKMPSGVRADPSGTDFLFGVIDTGTNVETDAYEFNNSGTNTVGNGSTSPITIRSPKTLFADAVGQSTTTCFSRGMNRCRGGASKIPQSSDELDPVELLQQDIPHKLRLVARCVSSRFVYPAGDSGGTGPLGCPPMGEMLWLDTSDANIEKLSAARWIKTMYHNLHDYGWMVADVGAAPHNHTALQIVSDLTWTATGRPSQWAVMLEEMRAEGTVITFIDRAPQSYRIQLPTAQGLTLSDFHWLRQRPL